MSKPTSIQLREWRLRMGWDVKKAAYELCVESTDLKAFELGRKQPLPSLFETCAIIERIETRKRERPEGSRTYNDIQKLQQGTKR